MRKSRFTEEQIVAALRQAEAGTPVEDITRKLGVADRKLLSRRSSGTFSILSQNNTKSPNEASLLHTGQISLSQFSSSGTDRS